jgi:membrane-associated phospholipid phosphatase
MTGVRQGRRVRSRPVVRSWQDLVFVGGGLGLLVLSALPVHVDSISGAERSVFRLINDHTVLPVIVVWTIMQLGNFLAIPAVALVAALFRRWRLAIGMLIGGVVTYYLAKEVKKIVERGRPSTLLDDVHIRTTASLGRGFVSGHAAVVTLLVVLAWPYLGKRARIAAVAAAIFVCLARVYVGAHLPLDIVGGAALGLAVAGLVQLVLGRPAR